MCETTTTLSDESLAEKFKREFTEQFHILVRMHLSFVLDLHTDESENISDKGAKLKKWNLVPSTKKTKTTVRGVMEGAPLTQEGICQVYQLIEFLKKEQNIKVEGIFRRTGSLTRQQDLRSLLNQGVTLQLDDGTYSIHDCASVLKGFLAELPDPLLTEAYYPAYCQIAELCGVIENSTQDEKLLVSLQLLLLLLPTENKVLLKDILDLLHLTASYESSNRMSADNLAMLFTPHLLCPRKLSPEQLHINSQTLSGIITFMIKNCAELFKIPHKLIVDFRVRYEKRKVLADKLLNESVSDQFAANTVFTFVDHERTAKENETNTTETALAQLYAHIQSLPESSKKRKLVKQFNKENGHGTPLQVVRSSVPKNNRSLGDSIKKHIFHKGLLVKSIKKAQVLRLSGDEQLAATAAATMTTNFHKQQQQQATPTTTTTPKTRLFCAKCEDSSVDDDDISNDDEIATKKLKQSSPNKKKSSKIISKVLLAAGSSKSNVSITINDDDNNDIKLTTTILSDESNSLDIRINSDLNNMIDGGINSYTTSTPAYLPLRTRPEIVFTPDNQERKSMSPITRSTQRMSRAMQETMMTPRSRKPVLLVSGTNIKALNTDTAQNNKQQLAMDNLIEEVDDDDDNVETPKNIQQSKVSIVDGGLSDTFREYLHSRSILTTSSTAADSSFSSRTDDFKSAELDDFSNDSSKLLMSNSLLFCLNGNEPPPTAAPLLPCDDDNNSVVIDSGEEKQLVLKPKQFDENGLAIVFETSF